MRLRFTLAGVCLLAISWNTAAAPAAHEIIGKVIERSSAADREKNAFAYQRVSRVDYLDENGGVKKNSVRVYAVEPVNGKPVSRLIQINGHPPKAQEEGKRSAAREAGDKSRTLMLSEDLLSRFQYELKGEDVLANRAVWVLSFSPRADVENDAFFDKLVNAMQGTLWIDQEDYELAKVDVHLGRKVSFFGGLAGAIEKLDLQLVQKRVDQAVWLAEGLSLEFTGRKLFTPIRLRCFETCTGFRKVAESNGNG